MILKAIDRRAPLPLACPTSLMQFFCRLMWPMRQHASGSGTAAREAPPLTEVQFNAGAVEPGQKAEPSVTPVGLPEQPQEVAPELAEQVRAVMDAKEAENMVLLDRMFAEAR